MIFFPEYLSSRISFHMKRKIKLWIVHSLMKRKIHGKCKRWPSLGKNLLLVCFSWFLFYKLLLYIMQPYHCFLLTFCPFYINWDRNFIMIKFVFVIINFFTKCRYCVSRFPQPTGKYVFSFITIIFCFTFIEFLFVCQETFINFSQSERVKIWQNIYNSILFIWFELNITITITFSHLQIDVI